MLRINLLTWYLEFDFILAGLVGFLTYVFLYKNKTIIYRLLSVLGLLMSAAEIILIIILNVYDKYWINNIYLIIFWIVMCVYYIRVLKGNDTILCLKALSAIPILIILYIVVPWYYCISVYILNKIPASELIIPNLTLIQYIVYGVIIKILIVTYIKKNKIELPKVTKKRKVTVSVITAAIILLVLFLTPPLVLDDVSTSLGTPISLSAQSSDVYYDDVYNAVREERFIRSEIIGSLDMIIAPDLYEINSKLFEEIHRDGAIALLSWAVIILTIVLSFKIQKQLHIVNTSALTPVTILWLCILGVYIISTITVLLGFIYVPFSFLISGFAVTIIYKSVKRSTNGDMVKEPENKKIANDSL